MVRQATCILDLQHASLPKLSAPSQRACSSSEAQSPHIPSAAPLLLQNDPSFDQHCSRSSPALNQSSPCSASETVTGQGYFRTKHHGQAKGKNGTRQMAGKRLKMREAALSHLILVRAELMTGAPHLSLTITSSPSTQPSISMKTCNKSLKP